MSKFAIVHNLDQLSEVQRQQYLRDASVHLGLDPDLNGLDLIWMNTDDGIRRLTAYARRGTTDVLRAVHGITVLSLDQHDGPGYVSFKATGKNKNDRQEIAVGASFTEGLKGDRLAAAVATAQTRALRRLTLQFVGLAVLDESEVNAPVTATPSPVLSQLALAPSPSVAPSGEPGKDITPVPFSAGDITPVGSISSETQEQFEARQAKLRADAIAILNAASLIPGSPEAKAALEGVSLQTSAVSPSADITESQRTETPKKARKPRGPNKAKVDLGPSEPVPTKTVTVTLTAVNGPHEVGKTIEVPIANFVNADAPIPTAAAEILHAVHIHDQATATVAPVKPRLTPDQVKPFRQRLFKIVNDHLEPNGFTPKEGMGNADKMRSFAQVMFSDITNMNELTVEQWEKYLTVLENKIKEIGPVETVKYIEGSIGI